MMAKNIAKFDVVRIAIREGLQKAGIIAELDFTMDGMNSISWVGPPGFEDLSIKVTVGPMSPLPEDVQAFGSKSSR